MEGRNCEKLGSFIVVCSERVETVHPTKGWVRISGGERSTKKMHRVEARMGFGSQNRDVYN